MDKIKNKVSWYLAWAIQYWRGLFDFTFSKYFIIQMLPMAYGMMLIGLATGLLYVVVETFIGGHILRGLFYLFFAAPMTFLVVASFIRALMEFYIVIFRIAEDVDELVGIRDTVNKLSGLSEAVDDMANVTRRIPFLNALTRRNRNRATSTNRHHVQDGEDRPSKPE